MLTEDPRLKYARTKSVYLPACGVEHLYKMAVTPRGADSGLVPECKGVVD